MLKNGVEVVLMTKEEVQMNAFKIIGIAGDAINSFYEAMYSFKKGNVDEAKQHYEEGETRLNDAHQIQTNLIHAEVNDEELPYSLIMCHAQDHLTLAINWQRLTQLQLED